MLGLNQDKVEKISIKQFCEFVGLSENDRFVLSKLHSSEQYSLNEWHNKLKGEFSYDSSRITLLLLNKVKEAKNKKENLK